MIPNAITCGIRQNGSTQTLLKVLRYRPVTVPIWSRNLHISSSRPVTNFTLLSSNRIVSNRCTTVTAFRYASQDSIASSLGPIPSEIQEPPSFHGTIPSEIPEPPSIPIETLTEQVLVNGEATFASLGLGGWTPVGMLQNCLEFLHISCDLPWWGAIAVGTVAVRVLLFPLVILAQRNAAKMNNNLPQLQVLQMKMSEARQSGNSIEAARYGQEMVQFMREKDLNPLKNMIVPLAQAPLFISFFMGLRRMANTPVESMREGGLFWFTDLTVPDPYFLLPVITCATLFLTIEIGTDSARLSAQNMNLMKYFLRALPVIILPFTINFPGAILCYWVCSNFISLGQVAFLRIPTVRSYFKIDKMIIHKQDALPVKKKGFVSGVKESWSNMKITRELEERARIDEIRFAKAGKGPLVKTYKHDPTKSNPANTVQAKKG